jgi:SAM-dependent methyltransferase
MMHYSGERMIPAQADGATFWEHITRYRFAASFVQGKRVLDIACGEGYGAAALSAAGAQQLIGVDVDADTCEHARQTYRVDARQGSAEDIPLADASVDVIVSFETIEHLSSPHRFLEECHRVLAPGGQIVISTPNQPVYDARTPANPFHHHEMTLEEFRSSLAKHFTDIRLSGQCLPPPALLTLRGLRRLRTWWYHLVAPHMLVPLADEARSQVQHHILRPTRWQDSFDPYAIRELPQSKLERATYLIATANRAA